MTEFNDTVFSASAREEARKHAEKFKEDLRSLGNYSEKKIEALGQGDYEDFLKNYEETKQTSEVSTVPTGTTKVKSTPFVAPSIEVSDQSTTRSKKLTTIIVGVLLLILAFFAFAPRDKDDSKKTEEIQVANPFADPANSNFPVPVTDSRDKSVPPGNSDHSDKLDYSWNDFDETFPIYFDVHELVSDADDLPVLERNRLDSIVEYTRYFLAYRGIGLDGNGPFKTFLSDTLSPDVARRDLLEALAKRRLVKDDVERYAYTMNLEAQRPIESNMISQFPIANMWDTVDPRTYGVTNIEALLTNYMAEAEALPDKFIIKDVLISRLKQSASIYVYLQARARVATYFDLFSQALFGNLDYAKWFWMVKDDAGIVADYPDSVLYDEYRKLLADALKNYQTPEFRKVFADGAEDNIKELETLLDKIDKRQCDVLKKERQEEKDSTLIVCISEKKEYETDLKYCVFRRCPSDGKSIKEFWMQETEVTYLMFHEVTSLSIYDLDKEDVEDTKEYDALVRETSIKKNNDEFDSTYENCPMLLGADFSAIDHYIDELNKNYAPEGMRFRLPTYKEWEYACKAGESVSEKDLDLYAWTARNSDDCLHVVRTRKPNAWGLFDMYGNADELCVESKREEKQNNGELGRNLRTNRADYDPDITESNYADGCFYGNEYYHRGFFYQNAFYGGSYKDAPADCLALKGVLQAGSKQSDQDEYEDDDDYGNYRSVHEDSNDEYDDGENDRKKHAFGFRLVLVPADSSTPGDDKATDKKTADDETEEYLEE